MSNLGSRKVGNIETLPGVRGAFELVYRSGEKVEDLLNIAVDRRLH